MFASVKQKAFASICLLAFLFLFLLTIFTYKFEVDQVGSVISILKEQRDQTSRRLNYEIQLKHQADCYSRKLNTTSSGGWCNWAVKNKHLTDEPLVDALISLTSDSTVASFGDGTGEYRRLFMKSRQVDVYDSYDGAPFIEELTNNSVQFLDLTVRQYGVPLYDWILSIEVAEHIPKEFELIYVDNLIRHARIGIVISWAFEGQTGFSHVNPRPFTFVQDLFRERCFDWDRIESQRLRRRAHFPWTRRNVQVFKRVNSCAIASELFV